MTKKSFKDKLAGMPIAVIPTMVGAATLSNMWAPLGFTWIRHLTMWVAALVLICYLGKIIFHFNTVKKEYTNTVPASLYAGLTMITMILGSYVFDYNPIVGKTMWALGLAFHTLHLCIFIFRNVIQGVKIDTFVPSWFVTLNGIMVSCVVGLPMNQPTICKMVVFYGITALVVTMPFMIVRLVRKPLPDLLLPTKAILLAPSSLCLVSYLNFITEPHTWVVYVLYAVVFITLIYILINLPKFFSFDFHPGFAGLTFPMAIGIVASNKMSGFLTAQGYEAFGNIVKQVAGLQLYITTAIIGYVVFNFFMMLRKSYQTQN